MEAALAAVRAAVVAVPGCTRTSVEAAQAAFGPVSTAVMALAAAVEGDPAATATSGTNPEIAARTSAAVDVLVELAALAAQPAAAAAANAAVAKGAADAGDDAVAYPRPPALTVALLRAAMDLLKILGEDAPAAAWTVLAHGIVAPLTAVVAGTLRFLRAHKPIDVSKLPKDLLRKMGGPAAAARISALDPADSVAYEAACEQGLVEWLPVATYTWSIAIDAFAAARATAAGAELCSLVATLDDHGVVEAAHWLHKFLLTPIAQPCVILVPELGEAYTLTATGVVDFAQLSILLSEALRDPLARIGASGPAPLAAIRNARGFGNMEAGVSYKANFHLYPWQAVDPRAEATPRGLPVRGRYAWRARTGMADHSFAGDVLLGEVTPFPVPETGPAGGRDPIVLVLVGPRQTDLAMFTRVINVVRVFPILAGTLGTVALLPSGEAAAWTERVRAASARLAPHDLNQDAMRAIKKRQADERTPLLRQTVINANGEEEDADGGGCCGCSIL